MSNQDEINASSRLISIKRLADIQPQEKDPGQQEKQAASALKRSNLHQEIADLKQQKDMMLEDLRKSINLEKEKWSQEKDVERKQAQEKGYQAGYEMGVQEAKVAWKESLDQVNQLTDQAKKDYNRTIDKHEETIIQLAVASAEKIIHQEIQADKTLVLPIISAAIDELKNEAYIHIYIHPEAYELVIKQKPELEQIVGTKDLIFVYVDSDLNRSDCVIKHPNGQIDVGIDSQLRQIKNALFEKVMNES